MTEVISRQRFQIIRLSDVVRNQTDVHVEPAQPAGDRIQISWIIFGDQNVSDNKSGYFCVEWGDDSNGWEIISCAYLTGDTRRFDINRTFVGDGAKHLRITRTNHSSLGKSMVTIVDGFSRVGDIVQS